MTRPGTPQSMDVTVEDINAAVENAKPGGKFGPPAPPARPSIVEFCDDPDCEGHPPPAGEGLSHDCPDPGCCPEPDPEGEQG